MFTARQRDAMRRQSTSDLLWLLVPGRGWRDRILPADQPALAPLRRGLAAAGLAAGLAIAAWWTPAAEDAPLASQPAARPSPPAPPPTAPPPVRSSAAAVEKAPAPTPEPEPPGGPDERTLAEKRTQLALFADAKVSAVYAGHDVEGVRIERVGPGSFWDLVGVRSGDLVIEHDGTPIDTPAAMVALLNAMEQEPVVRLVVVGADGEERLLHYAAPR